MSKICSKCGTTLKDNATFCHACGENQVAQVNYAQSQPLYYSPVQTADEHTGIGAWIGWLLLCTLLPLIGQIIALCCTKDNSVKNWAIANLIISAIGIVFIIFVVIIFVSCTSHIIV